MNKRLFFLDKEGWFEAEVTGKLLHASNEELVLWAYAMMERKNYRNYLITENPERVLARKDGNAIAMMKKEAS
jgi:hypothetical protein